MVEDEPVARTPKYASFSPSKKAEDETKVGTVDVSYVDPLSQKVSSKEVYVDPETWWMRANTMRFLISADLVNLVTESQMVRRKRFRKAKKVMEETRLAFLVDLWKLRGLVGRVHRAVEVEEELVAAALDEPCPVRFFVPEMYFDDHTLDCITKAGAGFSGYLLEEIRILQERLDLLGGKNWRNLLAYALKYMKTTEIGEIVVDAFPDVSTRRTVENAITRGLWDQIEELQPVVDDLEGEMVQMRLLEDCDARVEAVQEDIARKLAAISSFNERHVTAVTRLQEPDPVIPPDSASEIEEEEDEESESDPDDESATSSVADAWDEEEEIRKFIAAQGQPPSKAELKKLRKSVAQDTKIAKLKSQKESRQQDMEGQKRARVKSLLAKWEKSANEAQEEVKELDLPLQRAEHKTNQEIDEEVLKEAEAAKAMEAEAETLAQEASAATEKAQELTAQVEEQTAAAEQEKAEVTELVQEKASLPPPDPRSGLLRRLAEEQAELMKQTKVYKEKVLQIKGRLRLLKMELRELYRMLGWPWEDSDSDDDGEEKPYWLRKRLAKKTATEKRPFNEHHFLNQEDKVMERRIKRMASQRKLKDTNTIMSQLQAARRTCKAKDLKRTQSMGDSLTESSVLPFKVPEQKRSLEPRASEEAPEERDGQRSAPRASAASGSQGGSGARQLRQLREILESQLRTCAECFRALLGEGSSEGLAELRPRLDRLLELQLGLGKDELNEDQSEYAEQLCRAEDSFAALQGLIGEAVGYGSSELRQSLDVGELRRRLSDIRTSQRQLQHELRKLAQPRRSVSTPFETEFLLSSSRMSSHSMLSMNEAPPSQDGDASLGFKEPGVGGNGKLQDLRRKTGRSGTRQGRPEAVDFGFRPDGAGEESMESWSLFKVSKAAGDAGGATVGDPSATGSLSGTRPGRVIRPPGDRNRAQESKMSRLQNVALYCDFSDYMSQLQQSATEMWHSASSPELGKKGPSLPDLVKTKAPEELSLAVASSTGKGRWKFSNCYGGRKKAPPDAAWTTSGW